MPKAIHIKVTEADIVHGVRFSPLSCPIARAVSRATQKELGTDTVAHIGMEHCYILQGPDWLTVRNFEISDKVKDFVRHFDYKTANVEAFEFDIFLGDSEILSYPPTLDEVEEIENLWWRTLPIGDILK